MNKRIDELFGKALDEAVPETWTVLNPEQLSRLKIKFAELIVRECVQSIERTIETSCEFDSEKMGCEFAITDLKKHFGVE